MDEGDFVANYANDGNNSVLAFSWFGLRKEYHVGQVAKIAPNHSNDLTAFVNSGALAALALLTETSSATAVYNFLSAYQVSKYDHTHYADDLNLSINPLSTNTVDSVGASIAEHGIIQINASPILSTIDSLDKSYATSTPNSGTVITTGALAGTPVDKDWYSFATTIGSIYTVTVTNTNISSGRMALAVKNSAGTTIDVNQIGNANDDVVDSASGTSTISFKATGTLFYAAVSAGGADGVWQFATGGYNISLAQSAASSVSISDMQITEGNSGTKVLTFTVTRSGGTAPFDVNYTTADGSANVADNDYVAAQGTLHFGANVNTQTIQVTIKGDVKVEPDQIFSVLLSGATNGTTISRNQATGTILTDDTTPRAESDQHHHGRPDLDHNADDFRHSRCRQRRHDGDDIGRQQCCWLRRRRQHRQLDRKRHAVRARLEHAGRAGHQQRRHRCQQFGILHGRHGLLQPFAVEPDRHGKPGFAGLYADADQ
jgi:hypothetical protein